MMIKKGMTFILLVTLLLTLTVGCNKELEDSVPVKSTPNTENEGELDNPLDSSEGTKQEVGEIIDKQKIDQENGEVTDPVELEKLWQDYLYDSITTIGNTREFNSTREIDPLNVARFCWKKYLEEHGQESLELAPKDSYKGFFPLETALLYAEKYFNLTDLDLTNVKDEYYDHEKSAFVFNFGTEGARPAHTDYNPWGILLHKVKRTSDGTVTAVLASYDSYETRRIQLTKTYTLMPREDGSLYYTTGRWEYVNNHLVSLSGDYQHFAKIEGHDKGKESDVNQGEISLLGEDNNYLIMANTSYDENQSASLLLLNPETMKVEKSLDLHSNLAFPDVRIRGEKIVTFFRDRILTFDKSLVELEKIELPQSIKDKIERDPKYDSDGIPDIYFGGYDISGDLQKIVYADEIGLKLYNLVDGSEELLSPIVPVTGSRLLKNSYHSNPRFIANDRKVITTMTGYESTRGYTIYSLEEAVVKTYDITSESSFTGFIRYDTGLIEIKSTYNMDKEADECSKILYLDFKTGVVKEIKLADMGGDMGMRDRDSYYVGQNYAAFITYEWFDGDYANNISHLNLLNLDTLQVKAKIASVKAAHTQILGVLTDGRIIFSYNLNPSENGICITK